ncbi:MAG: 3-deoxy-D-manno-octulosonic acid transferase [Bacteroidota bacterium]
MGPLTSTLYRGLVVPLIRLGLVVLAPFNEKLARRRRDETRLLQQAKGALLLETRPRVWFHAASMGELEQLIPVIEQLRASSDEVCIVSTCTSASGREHAERQACIDHALYLPVDQQRAMSDLVDIIKPSVVVIDRYDLWPVMISTLHHRRIITMLVNATMPSTGRNAILRGFTRRLYLMIDTVIAVSQQDAHDLAALLGREIEWKPDTRMDRILQRRDAAKHALRELPPWHGRTLVLGSTWPADEALLLGAWHRVSASDWRLVLVPHEPTEQAVSAIEQQIACRRLSAIGLDEEASASPHIVVDSVGKLLQLYAAADAAYVGGGFGVGVHSLAEPAGFGLPVACGPAIERSRDARGLLLHEALTIVRTQTDAAEWLTAIQGDLMRALAREHCNRFVSANTGSSGQITQLVSDTLRRVAISG